jgi:phenylacetate-coenzyme A ligase PaaK-like adenylate-forming protein
MNLVNKILTQSTPFERDQSFDQEFISELNRISNFHYENCIHYKNFINNNNFLLNFKNIDEIPFLPVRLFKLLNLKSIPDNEIFKTMTSSGTSGQSVSKIHIDKYSAKIQTKVLSHIVTSYLGRKRRNMLIIDSRKTVFDKNSFSARKAGILGFSSFGKNHSYLLNDDLELNLEELTNFLNSSSNSPIFLFGFTFLIWQKLILEFKSSKKLFKFPENSILIHGGGWKKLLDKQVNNKQFKESLVDLGIRHVFDYYGMIEQTGSIFIECEAGYLHCSDYSDILIRDPKTFKVLPFNNKGIIQVLSLLPTSYPGHSLLTEDLGEIIGTDDCECGKKGKYFRVLGRMKASEIRGCSDTRII